MEAIVLAGGFGTRLAGIVKDVPKPMAPVAGHPFLEYVLDLLLAQGVDQVVIAVCHKKECIINHFGTSYRGVAISYSEENTPLLTGGAIKKALEQCHEERVFVLNGDTFFDVDLKSLREFSKTRDMPIVIAVKELTNFSRYGTIDLSGNGIVSGFAEKHPCVRGFINGGIYDICRSALQGYPEVFSFEEVCMPEMINARKAGGVLFDGFFIDIGVPEDYTKAQKILGSKSNA